MTSTTAWRATAPYRPMILLMLVSSTASFAALGVLALFARDQLGASDIEVTLNFVVVALSGMAVLPLAGYLSDRPGARRVLVSASLAWLAAGYVTLSLVRSYPALLAAGAVFFGAVGVPSAQLLAHVRELAARRAERDGSTVATATMRIALSFGSFTGFGLAGFGLAHLGARTVFRMVALVCLGCALVGWHLVRTGRTTAATAPSAGTLPSVGGTPQRAAFPRTVPAGPVPGGQRLLLLLAVVMVLYSSGRVMLLAQLPILMRDSLGAPLELIGFALALPPLCELALMPAMAFAALRWGRGRVFLLGGCVIVAYYVGLVLVTGPGQVLLLQAGYALFGAATVMVGIDLAQRLLPDRAGAATSVYLNHENVAALNGSIVATVAVATLGHRIGFMVPAALCVLGLVLTAWAFVRRPDAFDVRRRSVNGR